MANEEKCQLELIVERRMTELKTKASDYFYNKKNRKSNAYCMSCYYWDSTTGRMSKRNRFSVELTDDEYIYMLTEQLFDRSPNTFNRLVFSSPVLAEKICGIAELSYFDGFEIGNNPYLIIFDELLEDVDAIACQKK